MAPSGNPLFARVSKLETTAREHAAWLGRHDKAIREMNLDMATLADIVHRSQARAVGRLVRRRRDRTR